jgi:CHAD domain-containing protein
MGNGEREIERKYDVDDAASVPDLRDLPGVSLVSDAVVHHLEAAYFDTQDLDLARNDITLRRRSGGDDEGWHLKLPLDDDRYEVRVPLRRSVAAPPAALRRIVHGVVRDATLVRVVTLTTEREVRSVHGDDGALLALVCDDRVAAVHHDPDGDRSQTWREWELELHHGRRRFAKRADARLRAAGARDSGHASKLVKALALPPAPRTKRVKAGKQPSEHELLQRRLAGLVTEMARLDPLVRADAPDAVHQMRVACRRLRATLATFAKRFDHEAVDGVRADLTWTIEVLGAPRDLEVLRARLGDLVAAQPRHLVRGRPDQWLGSQLRAAHRSAHREAAAAMTSDRYVTMVDTLRTWSLTPPWANRADRPAQDRLTRALDREWQRLARAVATADAGSGTAHHAELLHDVRKAAKRTRYAAETLQPVLGKDASGVAATCSIIQDTLGAHHDTVVATARLLDLAGSAHATGRDTFTYGVLYTRIEREAEGHERDYHRAWKKAAKARSGSSHRGAAS